MRAQRTTRVISNNSKEKVVIRENRLPERINIFTEKRKGKAGKGDEADVGGK
jgi:hypothetical protein